MPALRCEWCVAVLKNIQDFFLFDIIFFCRAGKTVETNPKSIKSRKVDRRTGKAVETNPKSRDAVIVELIPSKPKEEDVTITNN